MRKKVSSYSNTNWRHQMPTYPLGSSSAWDLTSWLEDSFHSLNRFNEAKSRLSWLLLHVFCTTGALERKDSHKTVLQIYQAYSNQGKAWWCPPIWLNWLNEAKSWLRFFMFRHPYSTPTTTACCRRRRWWRSCCCRRGSWWNLGPSKLCYYELQHGPSKIWPW